jgi:hypothetical protein
MYCPLSIESIVSLHLLAIVAVFSPLYCINVPHSIASWIYTMYCQKFDRCNKVIGLFLSFISSHIKHCQSTCAPRQLPMQHEPAGVVSLPNILTRPQDGAHRLRNVRSNSLFVPFWHHPGDLQCGKPLRSCVHIPLLTHYGRPTS